MEYDLGDVNKLVSEISNKFSLLSMDIKCSDISVDALMKKNKETLAEWLFCFTHLLSRSQRVLQTTSATVDKQKNTIISFQKEKLTNQERLLDARDQAMNSFQSTFQTEMKSYRDGFQSTLRSEMKSYRDVAFENIQPVVSSANIEPAMKKAVQDGERSKNIILFGVKESEDEEVESAVTQVFANIGEKPQICECLRLGKKSAEGPPRPIKVCLRSSETAFQLQLSGRRLKDDPETKRVFISPDRSREEREVRRGLVKDMRERMRSDSSKYHYIHGTEVLSRDRNPSSKGAPPVVEKESHRDRTSSSSKSSDQFKVLLERSKSLNQKITNGT